MSLLPLALTFLLAACTATPDAGPVPAPASPTPPAGQAAGYEAALTAVLQAVVTEDGLVDYDALGTTHADAFAAVLAAVEGLDPAALTTDAERVAFFLNAYNVRMLALILGAPEVTNIETDDRFGAFFRAPVRVAGMDVTLNHIENGVLRRQDTVDGQPLPEALAVLRPSRLDPRVHFGLNCAAVSCPRLRREAFTPEALDAQLDAALVDFADGDRVAAVEAGRVALSALLDWFGDDFDASGRPVGDFFLAAMSPTRPGYAAIRPILEGRNADALRAFSDAAPDVYFFYDWTVNRLK